MILDDISKYLGMTTADPYTDPSQNPQANVKPVSTTINYNDAGGATITNKHEIVPEITGQPAPVDTAIAPIMPQPVMKSPLAQAAPAPVAPVAPVAAPIQQPAPAPVANAPARPASNPADLSLQQSMMVSPAVQQQRDATRMNLLQQEAQDNPNDPALQKEIAFEKQKQAGQNVQVASNGNVPIGLQGPVAPTQSPVSTGQPPTPVSQWSQGTNSSLPPAAQPAALPTPPQTPMQQAGQAINQATIAYAQDPSVDNRTALLNARLAAGAQDSSGGAYAAIIADPNEDPLTKQFASKALRQQLETQDKQAKIENDFKAVASGTATPQQAREISQALTNPRKTEEGSWAKWFLFGMLGAHNERAAEATKLGIGNTFEAVMGPDGKGTFVEKRANGEIVRGWDDKNKELNATQLAEVQANSFGTKGVTPSAAMIKAPDGRVFSELNTPQGKIFVNTVATPGHPVGERTREIPVGSTPFSQVSQASRQALSVAAANLKTMNKANNDAKNNGAIPPHSAEDIAALQKFIASGGAQEVPGHLAGTTQDLMPQSGPVSPAQSVSAPAPAPGAIAAPGTVAAPTAAPKTEVDARRANLLSRAQQVYDGKLPYPVASGQGAAGVEASALRREVQNIAAATGKPFDANRFKENQKTLLSYEGDGQQAKQVNSIVTSVNHMADALPLFEAQANGKFKTANEFYNALASWSGDPAPTSAAMATQLVMRETEKFLSGGQNTGEERAALAKLLDPNQAPEVYKKSLETLQSLMVGKLEPYKNKYEQAGGDFWGRIVNNDDTKAMFEKHKAEQAVRKGQAGQGKVGDITWKVVPQ